MNKNPFTNVSSRSLRGKEPKMHTRLMTKHTREIDKERWFFKEVILWEDINQDERRGKIVNILKMENGKNRKKKRSGGKETRCL